MAEKQSKEMQAEVKENQAAETQDLLVKVTREKFGEKDGVSLYSYHIHAVIRGKDKKFVLFDDIYDENNSRVLKSVDFGYKIDELTGEIIT